jgi:hypothetical protein
MAGNDKGTKPKIIIGIIIILLLISVFVIFVLKTRTIVKIVGTIATIGLIVATVFSIAWLFWYIILRKERYDVTYVNKKKLMLAGKLNNQKGVLGDLYVSGDKGHKRIRIGKIIGYCRIQIIKRTNKYDSQGNLLYKPSKKGDERIPDYDLDSEEQDIFIIKKGLGIFSEPLVIRVSPTEHDELIGDVTLKGFSILPISEYWFLNNDYLDVRKIDFAILKEAERGIMFENLRDMKTIVDRSIGLDSSHRKDIEKKNLLELPEQNNGAGR